LCCVVGEQQKRCQDLDGREKGVQGLLTTGQEMMDSTQPDNVNQVAEKLKKLKDRWQETRDRAIKRKVFACVYTKSCIVNLSRRCFTLREDS
jgi:hypothetical protein